MRIFLTIVLLVTTAFAGGGIGGKAIAGGKAGFGASTPVIAAGCGDTRIFDSTDCGAAATTLYTTIDSAINAGTGGTAISACGTVATPNTSYYVTIDLGSDLTTTCLTVDGRRGVKIDLNGHTITGRVVTNQNNGSNDGFSVFNGNINCSVSGGGSGACLYADNGSAYTDTLKMKFHHLTVTNSFNSGTDNVTSTGTPFAIYIDRTGNNVSGQTYYIGIQYCTVSLTGNNYNSVRTGTVQTIGTNAEISNNLVTIPAGAGTAQGLVVFGATLLNSRIHHNKITTALTAYAGSNTSTARAIAFDDSTGSQAAPNIADFNDVTVNDNRCFRARDSQFPIFRNNYCHDIRMGGASSGTLAAVHLGDPDPFGAGEISSIACTAGGVCTLTTSGHNFLGHAGDVLTITSATPSTMQETAVVTSATTTTAVYQTGNVVNNSQTSSGSPTMRYANQMNAQITNDTFHVACAVNKGGLVLAQRAALDSVYGSITITTDGNCASGFTGALFTIYADNAQTTALVENTVGFSLLGSGTIFAVSGATVPAAKSGATLCGTGGSQNDANALWTNISSGPCP